MDFAIPSEILTTIGALDAFIEKEIRPLENANRQYFDHRRENARTNWDADGTPRKEWEELLAEMRRRADRAGFLRWSLPKELGGSGGGNLGMAIIREHLAHKGLGLHNDLQNESSIVGNLPTVLMFRDFGTAEQKKRFIPGILDGSISVVFGLTEPGHGSDATWMETRAVREGDGWRINGAKTWNSGVHQATHDFIFARASGKEGTSKGIGCFIVPTNAPGFKVEQYLWTFNMPTDHGRVSLSDVWIPAGEVLGDPENGLAVALHFVHENRVRQAASSLGAAQFCINESVKYSKERKQFGKPISEFQAIAFKLADLATQIDAARLLTHRAAAMKDAGMKTTLESSMAKLYSSEVAVRAAEEGVQIHGGYGFIKDYPAEKFYRDVKLCTIGEGTSEIQRLVIARQLLKD